MFQWLPTQPSCSLLRILRIIKMEFFLFVQGLMQKERDSLCFFWDIQNCPVPTKRSPYECVSLIRDAVFKGDKTAEVGFNAYCDSSTLSHDTRQELSRARVHVRDVPSKKKGAADLCLQQDILRHTMTHRSGIIVLISGDVDFAETVHDLVRMGNYRVILIHNKQARPELCKNATKALKFEDVVSGGTIDKGGAAVKVKGDGNPKVKSDGKSKEKVASAGASSPKVKGNSKSKEKVASASASSSKVKGNGSSKGSGKPKEKGGDKSKEKSDGAKLKGDKSKPKEKGEDRSKPKADVAERRQQRQPRQRKWCCPECEKTFAAEESLSQHVEMTGHAVSWDCEECGKTFQSESAMQQHKDATGHDQIVCTDCGKEFLSENSLAQHLDATGHCANMVWMCPRCNGETWSSLRGLLVHLQQLDAEEAVAEESSRRQQAPERQEAQPGTTAYFKKWCLQNGGSLPGSLENYQTACAGDAAAQHWIASCFATSIFGSGYGLQASQFEALRWGLLAAQQGHVEAQWLVGMQYVKGEAVPKNLFEAERWLLLASKKGHARAQAMLEAVQRERLRAGAL